MHALNLNGMSFGITIPIHIFDNVMLHHWLMMLTHLSLGDLDEILQMQFSILFHWLVPAGIRLTMPSGESLLMIGQHWYR